MADFEVWVRDNWSNAIGAVGIIGSLWMAIAAAHREAKAKEVENLLALSAHHRELWGTLSTRRELERILDGNADVLKCPITAAEKEYINLVMVFYRTTWGIALSGGMITLKELTADVRGFFALPLPHAVWEESKQFRDPQFVRFVDKALRRRTCN
jgi:hypothetical protein